MTIIHTDDPDQYRDAEADGRFYHHGDDQFMSVTTALKLGLPSGHIAKWYAKIVAEYAIGNLYDLIQDNDEDEAVKWLKSQPTLVRDAAGDRGSLIHELCERYVLEHGAIRLDEYDSDIVNAVALYANWIDTMEPEFIAVEGVCYNRRHRYAGTMDMIVDLPGHGRVVIDIKSGRGVYGSAALQQTAYRRAEFIAVGDDEIKMPKTRGAFILHLQKTQWRLLPVETGPASWSAFLHALHTAYWIAGEGGERGAVGQPVAKGKL
ncbi:hypothetical protein ACFL0N_01695 [Pseudomonadota bacterium]